MSMVPRGKNGRYAKWTEADYNNVYPERSKTKTSDVPEHTPREEFTDYVEANHTAESNRNEILVAETIDFTGTDMVRKEQIAATIADNFTKEEIGKMTEKGNLEIVHGEKVVDNAKADASHSDRTNHDPAEVRIDDDADATAITHELVHHLRAEDKDRHGLDKTAYTLDENGHVLSDSKTYRNKFAEECAVIAETEIRTKEATDRPNVNLGKLDRQEGSLKRATGMSASPCARGPMQLNRTKPFLFSTESRRMCPWQKGSISVAGQPSKCSTGISAAPASAIRLNTQDPERNPTSK